MVRIRKRISGKEKLLGQYTYRSLAASNLDEDTIDYNSLPEVNDVNMKRTGMILKQLRTENNLTVNELRNFFRFDYSNAIYDWEKGAKLTNMSNLIALSTLYEVSIDEILLSNEQDFYFNIIELDYSVMVYRTLFGDLLSFYYAES